MFKHILVPSDGSELSNDTARKAVLFARETGAQITAFHAYPEYSMSEYGGEGILTKIKSVEEYEADCVANAKRIFGLIEDLCQEAGVRCQTMTLSNHIVYAGIIEAAKQCDCDLIFMASHGRSGLGALLLGSETNKVLTHTRIPVLVYR